MTIQLNSPAWRIAGTAGARRSARTVSPVLLSIPPEFLSDESRVAEEVLLEPAGPLRGQIQGTAGLDLSYDVEPGQTAILAVRHSSGALTFHRPIESTARGLRGPTHVRFQITVRQRATRGLAGQAVKAIVIKVAKVAVDKAVSFVLPQLVERFEKALWRKRGLSEGWVKVTKEALTAGKLAAGTPASPNRSLLLIHGTFSNTAAAYKDLAKSPFFERMNEVYGERIFGFDHFSLCRTPEENARMVLASLPEESTAFDVVTHSRGGLVLRNLVERADHFGSLARRFKIGRAVLVAAPNDGTPLATPKRWEDTIGWIANLLEIFPDNPFTTGSSFVADGLVWLANHASGDIPGLHAMDSDGDLIAEIQSPPGPPNDAYSALVANYQPSNNMLERLLDNGLDQFFGSANDLVVPSEGGWRIDRSTSVFIPSARIGCFGPGGNLSNNSVSHVNFFSQPETIDFLSNALSGRQQSLAALDPRKSLPDRRLLRGVAPAVSAVEPEPLTEIAKTRTPARRRKARALQITVINGDLTFEPDALLLGHYRSTRLTGTEFVMDELVGGSMSQSLKMGLYPFSVGSHQIFLNNRPNLERGSSLPRPKAVIVVGLGDEGKLRAAQLAYTVRQAVVAWAQRLGEGKNVPKYFHLAATLIGSGGTGITAGEAARLVARGVYEANELLNNGSDQVTNGSDQARSPQVSGLRLIELYLDRATEAWRSLRLQAAATPGRYRIADVVEIGDSALERPADSGYRGADYDFITVETKQEKDGEPVISYTLDTKRARSEVRAQRTQSSLLRELVATASNDQNGDQQISRTLFDLLVPMELQAFLVSSGEMQIELDPENAGIPWEMLDTNSEEYAEQKPWAIRVKLLRKLRIQGFRDYVRDAEADANALVIGEPECGQDYPRLFGARREAIVVQTQLTGANGLDRSMVNALISADESSVGADARTIINALFERPWRIVHIAGHGAPPERGRSGGVVLSNGTFLGPDEIRNMRVVPELVFVNCCYLASGDSAQLLRPSYDRAGFAAGVAGELIKIGVRCVIAAGWAVDDEAAMIFAQTFYQSLLRGNRFITAVAEAREKAHSERPQVNTWAAYQCYGDPDWIFRRERSDADAFTQPRREDYTDIGAPAALKLALQRIIVGAKFQGKNPQTLREDLQTLEKLYAEKWGKSGAVAELFGFAFVEAGAVERGLYWYEQAVNDTDGTASLRAAEQLGNVRSRLAWEMVESAQRQRNKKRVGEALDHKNRAAGRRGAAETKKKLNDAIRTGDRLIRESLNNLKKLQALDNTLERQGLVGSAYKRQALVDAAAGRRRQAEVNLRRMKASYERARAIGLKAGESDLYYPESNCLVADVALNAGRAGWHGLDRELVSSVQENLNAKRRHDANFWTVAGEIELKQLQAVAAKRLAAEYILLDKQYRDLHKRVTSTRMWGSVYDTAFLVLSVYGSRASTREKKSADALLELLRNFAHPDSDR